MHRTIYGMRFGRRFSSLTIVQYIDGKLLAAAIYTRQ